jgi:phospholipid-binding lipoprotein MlaA
MQSLAMALALVAAGQPVEPVVPPVEVASPATRPVIVLPGEATEAPPATPPAPTAPATGAAPPEIVVEGSLEAPPGDPLARVNAQTYEVVQEIDEALVEPLADGYQEVLPKPVRTGLANFFINLREPIVFVNFLLQGKPGKAFETLGRFAINSTIGIGGLIDVAKQEPFNLPRRKNGFANTLAIYGVEPGPFLVLPLIGPTTVRDLVGEVLDASLMPTVVGKPLTEPYFSIPSFTVYSLEQRIEIDGKLQRIRESEDPYATARELYLRERQAEIDALRGIAPVPEPEAPAEPTPLPPVDEPQPAPMP